MKKFALAMFLAVTLIFVCGQVNQAEAREVFVGTYSDGTDVYLLTETVQKFPGGRGYYYECDVRAGRDRLHYHFEFDGFEGYWFYRNSEGYSGKVFDGSSPVAANIFNFIRSNY